MNLELENIDTTFPAVITKVNSDGTVDCKPSIRKVYPNGVFDLENPDIPSVPIMKLGGSLAEFSFPSKIGDHILLLAFSRDACKWRESADDGDVVPDSASGLSLMDLVAIPFVKYKREGRAKITVTEKGDIMFSPADGRRTICNGDFVCRGDIKTTGEVAAKCTEMGDEISDIMAIHLSTHLHVTPAGLSEKPTPGT